MGKKSVQYQLNKHEKCLKKLQKMSKSQRLEVGMIQIHRGSNGSRRSNPMSTNVQKFEIIRAVQQIVKISLNMYENIKEKNLELAQYSLILSFLRELVQHKQKALLLQLIKDIGNLRMEGARKKHLYSILYCYSQDNMDIKVKRVLRKIIYQIYYKNFNQVWQQFSKTKQKSNRSSHLEKLKIEVTEQISDFRSQEIQIQKQMKNQKRRNRNNSQIRPYKNIGTQIPQSWENYINSFSH